MKKSILVKDLGMVYDSKQKRNVHRGIYQCTGCGDYRELRTAPNIGKCKKCGDKEASDSKRKYKIEDARLISILRGMRGRCYTKTNTSYHLYGGKGVTICAEWLKDPQTFVTWARTHGYKENLTIDKDHYHTDKSKPKIYSPDTCRWVTREENAKTNIRGVQGNNILTTLEVNYIVCAYLLGKKTTKELAAEYKVDITTIYWNINKQQQQLIGEI